MAPAGVAATVLVMEAQHVIVAFLWFVTQM